ncbi:MAG: efflux RND transporter periplasmic adaptor subunit [Planctomycetota bacterium]
MSSEHLHRLLEAGRWVWRHARSLIVVLAVLAAFIVGYSLRSGDASGHGEQAGSAAASNEPQWYTCSMHPEVRLPNPDDKCPICFMDLIPVTTPGGTSGDAAGPRQINLSPAVQALIDVQTVPVERRFVDRKVSMVGAVDYDETQLAYITAYVAGRLDRMFVDFTGISVRKGDHLAEMYSPELLVAQQELIQAKRSADRLDENTGRVVRQSAESILAAARERLRLLGLTEEQIASIESADEPAAGEHVTIYSPVGGVVVEKHAKPGSYLAEGEAIYTIADLSRVWVILEVYESDLPWLRYGQDVTFTTEAFGGEAFEGRIVFIDPVFDPRKRTVRVRVNVDNSDGRLRPGMFVRATASAKLADAGRVIVPELAGKWVSPMHPEVVKDEPGECPVCGMDLVKAETLGYSATTVDGATPPLVVPDSAVLRTGQRGVVYVRSDDDTFEGREVELGPRGEGFSIIREGLKEGEHVVVRGNFQIDSALQIQAKPSMMNPGVGDTETGHDHEDEPAMPRVHLHGDAAAPLTQLIQAYHPLAKALAEDDANAARQALEAFAAVLTDAEAHDWPGPVKPLWEEQSPPLNRGVEAMSDAKDLDAMRVGFQPISDALIALMQAIHTDNVGPLYRAHCPMAFDFTGASWLTPEDKILNPYFGASMLRCGTIEETLAPAEGDAHDHE